jgi:hypothetical protein
MRRLALAVLLAGCGLALPAAASAFSTAEASQDFGLYAVPPQATDAWTQCIPFLTVGGVAHCVSESRLNGRWLLLSGTESARQIANWNSSTYGGLNLGTVTTSTRQHDAVVRAFQAGEPAQCAIVFVATVNSTWAIEATIQVAGRTPAGCERWGSNGATVMHVEHHRWVAVTAGSDLGIDGPVVSFPGQPTIPRSVLSNLLVERLG